MRIMLAVLTLAVSAGAQDIASAAASPNALFKFVNTQTRFDWTPLWKALHTDDLFLPECDTPAECSAELIRVPTLGQVILVITHKSSMFEAFLRYRPAGGDAWQYLGAYQPFVKYFKPEHRMVQFGSKPFLVVTSQGVAETGLSSKIENWFDLTRQKFEPVFSFPSEGSYSPLPSGIALVTRGAVAALQTQPMERITVRYHVRFMAIHAKEDEMPLVERSDRVVYVRTSAGDFKEDESLSTATKREVEAFYDLNGESLAKNEFLKFNFKALSEIAGAPNDQRRAWLSAFLQHCPRTAEARKLTTLLAATR